MPNEIIIYRNPMEAAIWHSFMHDPLGIITIVLVVMFVGGFLIWLWSASEDTVLLIAGSITRLFIKPSSRRYLSVRNKVNTAVYTVYVLSTLALVVKVHNWLIL